MKKVLLLILTMSFFCWPLLMKKTTPVEYFVDVDGSVVIASSPLGVPPLVTTTSLSDTLPEETLRTLGLQQVRGTKIRYDHGGFASYFEYKTDPKALLHALSMLAIPIHVKIADTTYRRMDLRELALQRSAIPQSEIEYAPSFWNSLTDEFDAYECIKPPFRHTLLISKNGNDVLHRVDIYGV